MKNKKGFTLIELVIAIGLLSIFAITIGISLSIAELLGILEEIMDERK